MIDEIDRLIADCRAIGSRRRELAKELGARADRDESWHEAAAGVNELRAAEEEELGHLARIRSMAAKTVSVDKRSGPEATMATAMAMVGEARALAAKMGGDR